jgi:dihydrofolate reductase
MKVSLIAAMAENRAIGLENRLPWHLPADLRRFKALTLGHTLVMGRRTWESIGRPLPGRSTIVLSRRADLALPDGVLQASSLDEALRLAPGDDEVFVAGGEEVFRQALPRADRIYLTRIHRDFLGDTFFPEMDDGAWDLVERERHESGEAAPFAFSFLTYERIPR